MRSPYLIIEELCHIGQRMSEQLRYISQQHNEDTAFLLSQEWDLKLIEYKQAQGGRND